MDRVVTEWSIGERQEIVNVARSVWDGPIDDIQVMGSFCFGGFRDKSDIDVKIVIPHEDENYFDYRLGKVLWDRQMDIRILSRKKQRIYVGSRRKPLGIDLPVFSLLDLEVLGGNPDDVLWQKTRVRRWVKTKHGVMVKHGI